MTEDQKTAIRKDAERAARMGWTPNQMCPHPFASEQGKVWTEAYWAVRNPAEQKPVIDVERRAAE